MNLIETEYCGMMAGVSDGRSVGAMTVRLNRSRGNLAPATLQFTRSQMERMVEDMIYLLENAESLNSEEAIAEASERVDVSDLPGRDDDPYHSESPWDWHITY